LKVLFDTSVIVAALVDQLSNHAACFEVFRTYTTGRNRAVVSTHGLAECYSVLTTLPVVKRISASEALVLVRESVIARVEVVALDQSDYVEALSLVSRFGLAGGIVYDALHVAAARRAGCSRIYTNNVAHFRRICSDDFTVSAP
jgi:predicted nucleic acid-binding protein